MPVPDNAHQGHGVLRTVLVALALVVLLASMMMGWYVHESDRTAITSEASPAGAGLPQS